MAWCWRKTPAYTLELTPYKIEDLNRTLAQLGERKLNPPRHQTLSQAGRRKPQF
ncbi:MAG: hypothetical protein U1E47_06065 [Rivihabitans pingtungensis]